MCKFILTILELSLLFDQKESMSLSGSFSLQPRALAPIRIKIKIPPAKTRTKQSQFCLLTDKQGLVESLFSFV